jgi:hypothetical protein
VLPLVIGAIVLDAIAQVCVEWKRAVWGGVALRAWEKARLTLGRGRPAARGRQNARPSSH